MEKMVVGVCREFVFLTILQFCGWGYGRGDFCVLNCCCSRELFPVLLFIPQCV